MHALGNDEIDESTTHIGFRAQQYPRLKGPEHAQIMIRELRAISAYWPIRLTLDIRFRSERASEQALIDIFSANRQHSASYTSLLLLMYLLIGQRLDEDDIQDRSSRLPENFDCYSFAFGYVCLALGIDAVVARKRQLSLVVTGTEPKQLGLKANRSVNGEPPLNRNLSISSSKRTMFFDSDMNYNPRQLCDVRQIESEESGIEFEIDVMWVPIVYAQAQK